jgi:hypothetical protein
MAEGYAEEDVAALLKVLRAKPRNQ